MMKVLHLESNRYSSKSFDLLRSQFDVEIFDCNSQEALYEKLSHEKYIAIFVRLGLMIDEKAISLQPTLKYIVTPTTGLNHIDLKAAGDRSIQIISLRGESAFLANVKSTAEHTWGLLLSLLRKLPSAIQSVKIGKWDRVPYLSDELDGKVLGIIGYGRLGKIIARYGNAFGMNVLVNDIDPTAFRDLPESIHSSNLDQLLKESDVVVLLISWSEENEGFMNEMRFSRMKAGAYFINTSRGELVDETALLRLLASGHIKGAALDVLRNDSAWAGHIEGPSPLQEYARHNDNVLITPHMGGYGKDSIMRTRQFVTNRFLEAINSN